MDLLKDRLIRFNDGAGLQHASLPQVYAALVADRIESFPALRPHQTPAWHMFLVQLGVIAMHRAGLSEPPADAEAWLGIIRDLTADEFSSDEPWQLVVEDRTKPAFLQSPVPEELTLKKELSTPDLLDMVITAKNHDLKQAVAAEAEPDDWIFALISLQTGEGYNGSGNHGIARMNGGSSSRICLGLVPMPQATSVATVLRPGQRLRTDIARLLSRRRELLDRVPNVYPATGGCALTWTRPWPEGNMLALSELSIFFIEVCRRVRLGNHKSRLTAYVGTSKKQRIDAKQFNGVLGDPWAPVHKADAKALTLGENGEFDYRRIVELMLSGDWEPPLLATLASQETRDAANWLLVTQAFARGNSKTGGFKERIVPLSGHIARGLGRQRPQLHELANHQISEIETVDKILRDAVALGAAGGDYDGIDEHAYEKTRPACTRLKQYADRQFFPALWARFEAQQDVGEDGRLRVRKKFAGNLVQVARKLLDEALADLSCPSVSRPRAVVRARGRFDSRLRKHFPEYFTHADNAEDTLHASG